MSKKNEILHEPSLSFEGIENELEEIINRKKEEIEKDLEQRIQQEKNKAKRKLDQIEKDLEFKKEELNNYRTAHAEFEESKANIRDQKKGYLEKAIQYLRKIEGLTAQALKGLKKMSELDQKLDELNQRVKEKADIFKRNLEDKIEVMAEVTETRENEEIDLEQEREKLRKILELLGRTDTLKKRRAPTRAKMENEGEAEESETFETNEAIPDASKDE
jgi:hypothetical protein